MERSQSCTSFSTINNEKTNKRHNSTLTVNLCKTIELRKNQLQHVASSENLNALRSAANDLPIFHDMPLRKKTLKRQKSSIYNDDNDYAADLEENDEDDHESIAKRTPVQQTAVASTVPYQKHTRPQKLSKTTAAWTSCTTVTTSCSATVNTEHQLRHGASFDSYTDRNSPLNRRNHMHMLQRDNSLQSDSSRYSSVDSLLESRKPDPEAILINLGFGPMGSEDILSRIPKRFLKPSQVRGIDTEAFVKRLQLASSLADHSVLGYRGLTGNPDIPPSTIVAKIMERFEVNERKKSMGSLEHTIR